MVTPDWVRLKSGALVWLALLDVKATPVPVVKALKLALMPVPVVTEVLVILTAVPVATEESITNCPSLYVFKVRLLDSKDSPALIDSGPLLLIFEAVWLVKSKS